MENRPFVFGVSTVGNTFTAREKEIRHLLSNFQTGVNSVVVSPFGKGKTSLVNEVCRMGQSDNLKIIYLNILSCRSDKEFYDAFASAVLSQTFSEEKDLCGATKLYSFQFPKKSSLFEFSMSLEFDSKNDNNNILNYPEMIAQKEGYNIVVCIDDFQQVVDFKWSASFLKRLRSVWQQQKKVSYCLLGSNCMSELFEEKRQPLYEFGDVVYLPEIATSDWVSYICNRFEMTGKQISKKLGEKICQAVGNHSTYVQQLAWLVWSYTHHIATEQNLEDACQDIIDHNTPLFKKQTENLTTYQMNFLRAIVDGIHKEFTTRGVLEKYQLGSSANVSIIKRALIRKELIEVKEQQIVISDSLLENWLKKEFRA